MTWPKVRYGTSEVDWIGNAQIAYEQRQIHSLCGECNGFGAQSYVYDDPFKRPGQTGYEECRLCGGSGSNEL